MQSARLPLLLLLAGAQAMATAQVAATAPGAPQGTAQSVALTGMLGGRPLLMVDGEQPRIVAVGASYKGVKVLSTQGDSAQLELAGKRLSLRVGDAPASVGAGPGDPAGANRVVLRVGEGGHFFAQGQINGKTTPMVVDTGATVVSLSVAEAQRLGVDYQSGQVVLISTANGVAQAWRIKLPSVRVGDVQVYNVDSVVSAAAMPYVLLGNSFLSHFQMSRTNDQMVLEKRF